MQTHYTKNKLIGNERFTSELDSLIYQNIPSDYLIPETILLEKIYKDILKEFSHNKYSSKEISDSLKNMVQKKQVKELYGTKLSKYISIQ
ncbi:hypothetical protein EBU24_00255 [bacterium]|nr:hypothetical protein [bacterium]